MDTTGTGELLRNSEHYILPHVENENTYKKWIWSQILVENDAPIQYTPYQFNPCVPNSEPPEGIHIGIWEMLRKIKINIEAATEKLVAPTFHTSPDYPDYLGADITSNWLIDRSSQNCRGQSNTSCE